jgi:hypothetical protein
MKLDLSLSPDTRILADALSAVSYGQEISYAELSALIGRDVTHAARSNLTGALRIVLRDDGAAFQSIRGVGYRRLPPDDAHEIGSSARRKARRLSNRAVQGMVAVAKSTNGLSPDAQKRLATEISTLGLLAELSRDTTVAAQAQQADPVSPARAAQAFLRHIGATE